MSATTLFLALVNITNAVPFDVDVCFPRPPIAITSDMELGGLAAMAGPAVSECLLPPANHGAGPAVRATMVWKLDDKGLTVNVEGQENVTEAGVACLRAAASRVSVKPLAPGLPALNGRIDHVLDTSDLLKGGVNAASDVNAAIRTAQPAWCGCYDGYATKVPPIVTAKVALVAGKDRLGSVEFEAAPGAEKLTSCLKEKLLALPIAAAPTAMTFPRRFIHLHSGAADAGELPPEMAVYQLDRVRSRRGAALAIAVGATDAPQRELNDAGDAYVKSKGKPALLQRVRDACAALAVVQDGAIARAEELVAIDDALVATAGKLGAAWAQVQAQVKAQREGDAKHVDEFKTERAATAKSCPK